MINLINMPYYSVQYPNLALGLFKALLERAGAPCRVLDLNLLMADLIGYSTYKDIAKMIAADSAMNPDFFNSLIPRLDQSALKGRLSLFFQLKADLSRARAKALFAAGVTTIQLGIENLSTHLLKLMRKGTRGIGNIYQLKLCREYGIRLKWHFLVRIPGERAVDYHRLEKLLPKIVHLQPPGNGKPQKIELHKFSPYYNDADQVSQVKPKLRYNMQFPADRIDLNRIAYFFDARWADTLPDEAYAGLTSQIVEWSRIWCQGPEIPNLTIRPAEKDGAMVVDDSRNVNRPQTHFLSPSMAAVYRLTRDPCTFNQMMVQLDAEGHGNLGAEQVRRCLEDLSAVDLVIKERETYLGLALSQD